MTQILLLLSRYGIPGRNVIGRIHKTAVHRMNLLKPINGHSCSGPRGLLVGFHRKGSARERRHMDGMVVSQIVSLGGVPCVLAP